MQQKTINHYYLLTFLSSAGGIQIISAIYVTFLMENGLNLFEVNLVNAIYFTTLFICEIPTGAFADIFGRKASYVMSSALMSLSMLAYAHSETFSGFVCAEIIGAIAMTFKTGAFQSWLVDSLKNQGHSGSYNHIFGRASLYNQIGGGIGAISGSYMAISNQALPWAIGSIGMAIIAMLAYFIMREDYFVRGILSWKNGFISMRDTALTSVRYGSKDRAVRFILIITFIQIYSVQALNMYWQPFFRNLDVKKEHLGFIFTLMMIFVAFGTYIASRIKAKNRERKILLFSMVFVGATVIASAVAPVLGVAIAFFVLHEAGRGFWAPMSDSYLHQRIPSNERATITSFCGMAPHIGGALGLVVSGLIAHLFGITVAWIVAGMVLVGGAYALRKNSYSH